MGYARPPNPRISKSIRYLAYITLNSTVHTSGPDLAITATTTHNHCPNAGDGGDDIDSSRDEESKVKEPCKEASRWYFHRRKLRH
jgi:hypothetical protein